MVTAIFFKTNLSIADNLLIGFNSYIYIFW